SRAAWNGFTLSRHAFSLPMRRRDQVLQGVLERHVAEIAARHPAGKDIVTDVQRALTARVADGDTRLQSVARQLGASPRTLQRRLTAAGVRYQDLLERVRCQAAEKYLAESALAIGEVSWLLGYSEPSAFHRAFKRWRGLSPQAFRRQMRAGA